MSRKAPKKIQESPIKTHNRNLIRAGVELLRQKRAYSQLQIVEKLLWLNFKVSKPSFSNIVNNNPVGDRILQTVAEGIKKLILTEIGVTWTGDAFSETKEVKTPVAIVEKPPTGYTFYEDGRLPIAHKVKFFSGAKQEVIEFGVVLNTFAGYFFSRNEKEFKRHVQVLLAKGVDFKCFLLDPDCEETKMYFTDRAKHLPDELKSIAKIRETIEKLGSVQQQFKAAGYPGNFGIFTYQNIPNNYYMTVDGDHEEGRLMASHYLYGESRANCPVIEISKKGNPELYRRYWESLKKLVQHARELRF